MNRKVSFHQYFDTGSMLKQIQTILAQVSRALEAMVVLVLIYGDAVTAGTDSGG